MKDSNKDEAARSVRIAEAAIASGDQLRARKFIKIAQRLDPNICVETLLASCEKPDGAIPTLGHQAAVDPSQSSKHSEASSYQRHHTAEQVKLIREMRRSKDYYTILGVEKTSSGEEIRKAYRKLSLREAFRTLCKAFQCLSDEDSRRLYDQTGAAGDSEINHQYRDMGYRRRNPTRDSFLDEDSDPDEIFRSFIFNQRAFQAHHLHRTRGHSHQSTSSTSAEGQGFVNLFQILAMVVIFLVAFMVYSEPEYALQQTHIYQVPRITEKHGVKYYVRSEDFDQQCPAGSPSREKLEQEILMDYRNVLRRYCHIEMIRRQRLKNYQTPHCDKLQSLMVA
ncbi:unnamed protein product [Spirodela intermedia]|uniref:J domain-containing protein n=1 Tax=Spirodela intermedia TaxID=51605 RepID=A0A7I8IWS6_SPIIN|nr:unnamed protein product [Spirodela intermedia]CAA6662045.1 unnamed protein product [Spirodela intermedia]